MVSVLRPGQRHINIPGVGVSASQRAAASGKTQQPYLLNFANYAASSGAKTCGREFQVASAAELIGARLLSYQVETNVAIRLWRTDTQAQVASKAGVTLAAGENIITFAAAVPLLTTLTYRLSAYIPSGYYRYYASANDHPDGPVTILTPYSFVFIGSADAYPVTNFAGWGYPIEPTILA